MTGVDADLATLREELTRFLVERRGKYPQRDSLDALARVEAELSRLREELRAWKNYDRPALIQRAEAAEARLGEARQECARLQQALEDAVDVAEWLTGLMEIPMDSAWPTEMRPKLNNAILALAGLGRARPGDGQRSRPGHARRQTGRIDMSGLTLLKWATLPLWGPLYALFWLVEGGDPGDYGS